MIGQTVGHYKILEHLPGPDFATVYKARDLSLDRLVALMVIPAGICRDPESSQRCIHEARAATALDHPNICPTHDIDQTSDGQLIVVVPWYGGETLWHVVTRGAMPVDRALDIAIAIAEGLVRAHEAGIVHRRLQPISILVTPRHGTKIVDYGFAALLEEIGRTKNLPRREPSPYLPPEKNRRGTVDPRTDLWALGAILHEMVTGSPPSERRYGKRRSSTGARRHAEDHAIFPPETPEAVVQIITKALSPSPDDRYQTARAFLADLRIARGVDSMGKTTTSAAMTRGMRRRRVLWRSLSVGGAMMLLLALLYAIPPRVREGHNAAHPTSILITSFQNLTGIDSLNYFQVALQHQLITSLEQSIYFRPTSWNRLADLKRQARQPDSAVVDVTLGRELCGLDGTEALLTGNLSQVGDRITISARIEEVSSGTTLMTPVASGRGIESLFDQIDQLSQQISRGFGVSAERTAETIRPIEEITTRSQRAYQLNFTGWELVRSGKRLEALHCFEEAVKEDSLFARAWIGLRVVCLDLGYTGEAEKAKRKAISLFARVSEQDRLMIARIDTSLRTVVMGRPGTRYVDFLQYRVNRFPKEKDYLFALGLELQSNQNRIDESIDAFTKSLELDPLFHFSMGTLARAYAQKLDFERAFGVVKQYASLSPSNSIAYHIMGDVHVLAGQYDDAMACYMRARALEPAFIEHTMKIARVCFWREQYKEALGWIDSAFAAAPSPGKKADILWNRALCMQWLGRIGEAEALLRQRTPLLAAIGDRTDGFLEAWIALDRGRYTECRSSLRTWNARVRHDVGELEFIPRADLQYYFSLGCVDLREGLMDSVDHRLQAIERVRMAIPPSDSTYLATQAVGIAAQARRYLSAEVLLARNTPAGIPAMFPSPARAVHWDPLLAVYGPGWRGVADIRADIPYESDGLARAYAALGHADSAITLYEASIALGKRRWGVPPRLHYRLARLYEQKGLKGMAILEYEKFLKIWGKADALFKEPGDARARLKRIQTSGFRHQ